MLQRLLLLFSALGADYLINGNRFAGHSRLLTNPLSVLAAALGSAGAWLRFASKKLATREDPEHLHKTLGLLSIVSYLYRYFHVFPRAGNLGFEGGYLDWATMLLHLALSSSSLIFHVLKKRIISRPMVIWEEYRLHAIVFTFRCMSVYLFGYFAPLSGTHYQHFALPTLVLAHHLVVDEITRRYGNKDSTTVRVKGNSSPALRLSMLFYSMYQFIALASVLTPHERLMDLGFNALIAVQSSAFLMTCYRKGLIHWYSHAFWYSACLCVSTYHFWVLRPDPVFFLRILVVFILRTQMRMNKYFLWTVFAIVAFEPTSAVLSDRLSHIYARLPGKPAVLQHLDFEW